MARGANEIIAAVEQLAGLPAGILKDKKNRTHDVSLARHVACYVIRKETAMSFERIARAFGNSDHKFVIWGFNRVSIALIQHEPLVTALYHKAMLKPPSAQT